MSSFEKYRPIIFMLTWFLILEMISLAVLISLGEQVTTYVTAVITLFTILMLAYFIKRARREVLEEV
ncbi:hypothetical protein [Thermosphaera aggregans]|uniref:Uncharacterized protein n=1 Tax=Thermosphaera aggregans (strain DSM 11486 / M11TL) TaxID=633148 RepID=D5U2N7_THEAM|nr:hypothetical protein [Thermosphaera aggregans]ADG91387.1 hypothetical protein Tagg_1118 [Thermosphaera aggregans DSM 11486]